MSSPPLWLCFKQKPIQLLLNYFGIASPAVDVVGVANQLGIKVLYSNTSPWDGAAFAEETGSAYIYVNKNCNINKQRFIIAHELGHILLHPIGVEYRDFRSCDGINWDNIDANYFAVNFLMPHYLVKAYFRVFSIERLACILESL